MAKRDRSKFEENSPLFFAKVHFRSERGTAIVNHLGPKSGHCIDVESSRFPFVANPSFR
jgi:hypothetical protein